MGQPMQLPIEEVSECSENNKQVFNTFSPEALNDQHDLKKISYRANRGASRPSTANQNCMKAKVNFKKLSIEPNQNMNFRRIESARNENVNATL